MAKKKIARGAKEIPRGFKLRHTLRGHEGAIFRIAWSADGRFLASPSVDNTVKLWDAATGNSTVRSKATPALCGA